MTRATITLLLALASAFVGTAQVSAQEPGTRAEAARLEREKKATTLEPPRASRLERILLDLESGRLMERLLSPPEGFYPRIGNITAGSGISLGPGYRRLGLFGGHADAQSFAQGSVSGYWMVDARLQLPRLAHNRVAIDVHGQRYSFPTQEFFGIGPDSNRQDLVTYGLTNTALGVSAAYRPARWLTVGAGVDRLAPHIEASDESGALLSVFNGTSVPGALTQPDFLTYEASVDVNYRQPRGIPRRGGRYLFTARRFDDLESSGFSFDRAEIDLRQYLPILGGRRMLALRALASVSDADPGSEVPFYLQRTLGGPDDLRGFRRYRFRDRNALLFQAEYRWEIFTAVDGAIFYDTGKVASRMEDLNLDNLESDYGIGFRFGTVNGVFLRVEGAFGSRGGTHFIVRFGDAF